MLKGKAWRYGDDVDTDVIIPARYLTSSDPEALASHCMEDIDPEFAKKISPGDVIVAGSNFGCGSSREHAPISIKAAGVSCVVAKSFARIFFRNSFNIGLPILESAEAVEAIESGDEVEIDLESGRVRDLTKNAEYQANPVPDFMRELIDAGGLIPYTQKMIERGEVEKPVEKKADKNKEKKREPGSRMKELEAEETKGKSAPWIEEEEASAPVSPEDELERGEEDDEEE